MCLSSKHANRKIVIVTLAAYYPRILVGGLCALLLVLASGCDSTGDAILQQEVVARGGGSRLVSASASPRSTIDQCILAYQQLNSYEDDAFVRLRYELDGKLLEDRAPLSVGWEAKGRCGFQVYSVQAGPSSAPNSARWRLRVRDDEGLIPNQILSRGIPNRVDFNWLLSDPVVADRLSAGLAGFPPQLDLLLSEKPLSGLIDESVALNFLPPQSIDDRACYVILVKRGAAEFTLWIDQATLLMRRMQLPKSHLTEQMLADTRVSNIELIIEFAKIRTNTAIDWHRFAVDVAPGELLVNRFVPQPPQVDTTGLGEKVPGFHLESPAGEKVYDSNAGKLHRKATVMLWLADHPTCRVASEQMQRVATAIQKLNLPNGAVEFVTVWAEPQPAQGSTFASLPTDWNMPGRLALDREAMGRDVFKVLEAPTVVVVDANHRLQLREARSNPLLDQVLPGLLARIVDGEDLAQEAIDQQSLAMDRFRAELRMAAAADAASADLFPAAMPYSPQAFRLRELSRDPLPQSAISVCSDASQNIWTLLANGELYQKPQTAIGQSIVKHATRWQLDALGRARIEVAPDGHDVALGFIGGGDIQLFNTNTSQSRSVNLGSGAKIVDLQWFTAGAPSAPRLAVITRDSQLVLIDPANREQLSGRSPVEPVALMALHSPRKAIDGHVILADGTIEELQRSNDSLRTPTSGVGPKVTATTHEQAIGPVGPKRRLAFQPDAGPWLTWRDGTQELTLARGWLATDEPAVFLLDPSLHQRWHYRMPLQGQAAWTSACVAEDPRSGQPVWGISTADNTVHLLRADGLIIDHFRVAEPLVGIALTPNGERLELALVHARETVRYSVDWHQD